MVYPELLTFVRSKLFMMPPNFVETIEWTEKFTLSVAKCDPAGESNQTSYSCGGTGIRTLNQLLKRQLLYH